jgi:hypothetical protein
VAEPTLSLTLDELRREVARFLSFGRDYTNLNITQQEDVDSIIRRGLRQFYQPPPVAGFPSHQWSFLRPTVSFSTVANQETYQLPDDFGAMMGSRINFATIMYVDGPLIVSDYQYRAFKESSTAEEGLPVYATVRVRASTGDVPTPVRHDLLLWPKPTRVHAMTYQYAAIQDAVTGSLSYPAGAAMHGETIIASCLAIAEEYVVSPTSQYRQLFRERLASSISLDRHTRGGGIIGKMRPTGDEAPPPMPRISAVTYTPQ